MASISSPDEHGPRRGAAAGVADARGVVADDQHDAVARVLELAQLLQHDGVAEVDVGRGRVEAELDPQRPALALGELELRSSPPSGSDSCALRSEVAAASAGRGHRGANARVRAPSAGHLPPAFAPSPQRAAS